MARSIVAVHGMTVLVEYPDRLSAPLRRASSGMWVQQDRGSWNWFHFATATPIRDRDETVLLDGVNLRGSLENTRIDQVHLREGTDLVWSKSDDVWALTTGVYALDYPTGTGFQQCPDRVRQPFTTPGYHGYCLSARVSFLNTPSRIRFGTATFEYVTA